MLVLEIVHKVDDQSMEAPNKTCFCCSLGKEEKGVGVTTRGKVPPEYLNRVPSLVW